MRRTEQHPARHALLDTLGSAIHGVAAPFACGGTLRLDAPVSLNFRDGLVFPVKPSKGQFDQEQQNAPLIERCVVAPHGHERETLRDDRGQKALQCHAEGGVFAVQGFDPATSGVLEEVRKQLAPTDPNPITAELYALDLYNGDDHFRPHKAPRGDGLGTLVVCLPSFFSAGQLILSHRGMQRVFDWGHEINEDPSPGVLRWAAFFGDIDHAVERLWSGSRVTLSYTLRRGEGVPAPLSVPSEEQIFAEALSRALDDPTFLSEGGTVAVPCFHRYSQERPFQRKLEPLIPTTLRALKGRDKTIARVALARGLSVELHSYLLEDCADMRWELEHFPTPSQQAKLKKHMDSDKLGRALPILASLHDEGDPPGFHWVIPPPSFNDNFSLQRPARRGEDPPEDPDLPAVEYLHECEYSDTGHPGNEGSDTSFYVHAALHLRIGPSAQRATATAESDESAQSDESDESDEGAQSAVRATKTGATKATTKAASAKAAPKAAASRNAAPRAAASKAAATKASKAAATEAPKKTPSAAKSAGTDRKSAGTDRKSAGADKESKGAVKKWDWSF
jgi:hypothetical protein